MSLLSDALKRQEELRRATPPAAAKHDEGNREQGTGNGERGTGNGGQGSGIRDQETGNNRQTVKPSNPFLERERAAARRPNHSVLLMPILGLIVLLALLFLRREFISSPSTQVEGQRSKVESPKEPGIIPAATPTDVPNAESSVAINGNQTQSATVETNQLSSLNSQLSTNAVATTSVAIGSNRTQSAAVETNQLSTFDFRLSTNVAAATPPAAAVEPVVEPPPPKAWPAFTLAGIAVGRERIAILSTGEMLVAGETSTCGVKVEKVSGASVVFSLDGETKTLRKGEHSDKPADSR